MSARRTLVCVLAVGLASGCASWNWGDGEPGLSSEPYQPDRRDYMAFREAWPGLLEPNYLPFMVHRKPGGVATGDLLLLCRWPASAMPLRIHIEEVEIPDALQEFRFVDPALYTAAVERALAAWEAEMEGLVRFERVHSPADALLRFRVKAEEAAAPEPEIRVLGSTEALLKACRPLGWDPDSERMNVRFSVPETILYAADEFGLLTTAQVEAIAMHEIGHALGMLGHSPVPSDLMYRVLGDRTATDGLALADVNSFVSLYRLPNGTHYGDVQPDGPTPRPDPGPPTGGPELSVAPHVDSRLGFEIHTPARWLRSANGRGLFSANGPIWDNDASFEIFVWPYGTIEEYLERFATVLFENTWRRYSARVEVAGRPALEISVEDPTGKRVLDFFFVELGDGRVMVILATSPVEVAERWRPWFATTLASLEIWRDPSETKQGGAASPKDGSPVEPPGRPQVGSPLGSPIGAQGGPQ